jgi:energy-coupling factor transporter transmembrane protein EcfT
MIRDLRVGMAAFLVASSLSLPTMLQALLIGGAWMLPHLLPRVFTPSTPQRQSAWNRFQPFSVFFVFLSVTIQGVFGPEPRLEIPAIPLSVEGMELGLSLSLRAILLLTGVLVMMMPMPPLELANWLAFLRLPIGIPIAILLSIQLVEELPEAIQRILRAQRSRGVRLDGTLRGRFRALRFLVTPVVMRTLEHSLERATALQMRGLLSPVRFDARPRPYGDTGLALVWFAGILLVLRFLQWSALLPSID